MPNIDTLINMAISSENMHFVQRVKAIRITPSNSNCVRFDIETATGGKEFALFFDEHPEAAQAFFDALKGIDDVET
jgi:hypothetical protein